MDGAGRNWGQRRSYRRVYANGRGKKRESHQSPLLCLQLSQLRTLATCPPREHCSQALRSYWKLSTWLHSSHSPHHRMATRRASHQTLRHSGKYVLIHATSSYVLSATNINQMCSGPESALEVVWGKEGCTDLDCTPALLAAMCCSCCSFDISCWRRASASKIPSCWLSRGTLGQQGHLMTSLPSTEYQGMASSYKKSLAPTCLTRSALEWAWSNHFLLFVKIKTQKKKCKNR